MTKKGLIWLAMLIAAPSRGMHLSGTTSVKLGRRWCGPLLVMGLLAIAAPATPAVAQEEVETLTPGEALYEIRLADGSVFFARVTAVETRRSFWSRWAALVWKWSAPRSAKGARRRGGS